MHSTRCFRQVRLCTLHRHPAQKPVKHILDPRQFTPLFELRQGLWASQHGSIVQILSLRQRQHRCTHGHTCSTLRCLNSHSYPISLPLEVLCQQQEVCILFLRDRRSLRSNQRRLPRRCLRSTLIFFQVARSNQGTNRLLFCQILVEKRSPSKVLTWFTPLIST